MTDTIQTHIIYKSYTPSVKQSQARYRSENKEKYNSYMKQYYANLSEEKRQAIRTRNAEAVKQRRQLKKQMLDNT